MADLTPYAITLGATDYPSKYAGLLAYLEALLDANEENALGRNKLINGGYSINQRGAASIADDVYGHDRWYALTQSGSIAVSTLTDVENGTPFMARLTQSQVTAQRMGYAQIIEGINCKHMRGKTVTFEVNRLRLSAAANIRMAVLEWTGTEDAVTSDVVLNWTSGTYTAGNFFLASNLTVSGVVQQALTANTLTDGSAVTVTLGSSFNNLIVFVWTESAVAQNVTLDLGKAQLEIGSVATPFEHRPIGVELALCQRYAWLIGNTGAASVPLLGFQVGTTILDYQVSLPVTMRSAPTVTVSAWSWNATGPSGNQVGSYDPTASGWLTSTHSSIASSWVGASDTRSGFLRFTGSGGAFGGASGRAAQLNLGSTAWFLFSSEL